MARDPHVWTDVAELLDDYESELGQDLYEADDDDQKEDLSLRLDRVHDVRVRYLREFGQEELGLFVPAAGAGFRERLAPGSAVVGRVVREDGRDGRPSDGRNLRAYYEGNVYGASNLVRFRDRAVCAAGRLATDYPTGAWAVVPEGDLVRVGRMSLFGPGDKAPAVRYEVEVFEEGREALAAWIGVPLGGLDAEISPGEVA